MLRKEWHKKLQNDIVVINFSNFSKMEVIGNVAKGDRVWGFFLEEKRSIQTL